MAVLTVYNCGSGEHRDSYCELIANLAERTAGKERMDWLIFDGPGGDDPKPLRRLIQTGAKNVHRQPIYTSVGVPDSKSKWRADVRQPRSLHPTHASFGDSR